MQLHFALYRTLEDAIQQGKALDCFGRHLSEVGFCNTDEIWLTALQVQEQDSLDDSAAVDILAMIIAGGGHTTSSILQAFFKLMALHPEVVEKAHCGMMNIQYGNAGPTDWYRTRYSGGSRQAPKLGRSGLAPIP